MSTFSRDTALLLPAEVGEGAVAVRGANAPNHFASLDVEQLRSRCSHLSHLKSAGPARTGEMIEHEHALIVETRYSSAATRKPAQLPRKPRRPVAIPATPIQLPRA